MPEFRKQFKLPSAKLSRADIEKLGHLMCDGIPPKPNCFNFSLTSGDATYNADSIDELLNQELPVSIDKLDIRVHGWSEDKKIDRSITVMLNRNYSDCFVSSLDETWLKGKSQQMVEFFNLRKTWYQNRKLLVMFFGGLTAPAFLTSAIFLYKHAYPLAALFAILFVVVNKCTNAIISGNLFPHTNIMLSKVPNRISNETWMLILTAIGAIGTVVGLIVPLLSKNVS